MDFAFAPKHIALRETARRHMEEDAKPYARHSDETETFPLHLFKRWGELGILGARYPEDDGGVGMDKVSDCIIREEIARVSQAYCAAFLPIAIWLCGQSKKPEPKCSANSISNLLFRVRRSLALGCPNPMADPISAL